MQIHMWLYLSFSLWEKAFRLRIIQKKTDQRHFIATPNLSTFAVRCSVKNSNKEIGNYKGLCFSKKTQ